MRGRLRVRPRVPGQRVRVLRGRGRVGRVASPPGRAAEWLGTVVWLPTAEVRLASAEGRPAEVLPVTAVVRVARSLLRLPEALLQPVRRLAPVGPAPTGRRTATHTMTARGASRLRRRFAGARTRRASICRSCLAPAPMAAFCV